MLGTVNVIVDEVCGEGTWIKYSERSERWRKGEEERKKKPVTRILMKNWKSGSQEKSIS